MPNSLTDLHSPTLACPLPVPAYVLRHITLTLTPHNPNRPSLISLLYQVITIDDICPLPCMACYHRLLVFDFLPMQKKKRLQLIFLQLAVLARIPIFIWHLRIYTLEYYVLQRIKGTCLSQVMQLPADSYQLVYFCANKNLPGTCFS